MTIMVVKDSTSVKFVIFPLLKDRIIKKQSPLSAHIVGKHSKKLNINANKIAAGGGSAGGHLAAACGNIENLEGPNEDLSISSKPNALVLFNPVYDNSKKGYGFRRMEGRHLEISPLHNITKGAPPTIVFFGTNDKTTPVVSSKEYEQ